MLYGIASDAENPKPDDLRRLVSELNPQLASFEVLRNGEDVTLTFGILDSGGRVDFRLLGNRSDYYRMAMGVRIEETFRTLAQADPNLEVAGVRREGKNILFTVSYSGPLRNAAVARPDEPRPTPPRPPAQPVVTSRSQADAAADSDGPSAGKAPAANRYFVPAKPSPYPVSPSAAPFESPPADGEPEKAVARPAEPPSAEASAVPVAPKPGPAPETPSAQAKADERGTAAGVLLQPATESKPAVPLGAESEVRVPPPQESPPVGGANTVSVRPVPAEPISREEPPPEPSPAPPEPAGSRAERAFRAALAEGSLQSLVRFVDEFPESTQASEARRRADGLREEAAYQRARGRDEPEAYRAFLERYPDSSHGVEVQARLKVLEAGKPRAESGAQAESERRRRQAYNDARKVDNAKAYRVFLSAYPDGPEAVEVTALLQAVEADDAAFAEASSSPEGLDAYLSVRPKGRHAEEARARLQAYKAATAESAFRDAMGKATPEALEAFLKAWPKSSRAGEVRLALEAAKRGRPESGKPLDRDGGDVLTLSAAYVASAPAVDGKADDPAWRSGPVLEVPLSGGPGPRSVRVRAVHDGKSLYLLAQWPDATRDVFYRPWVWDAGKKTYRQSNQLDDAFGVLLYRGRAPTDACMLQGQDQEADLWLWRAFWSEVSGLAEDGSIRVSRNRIPKANPYPDRSGSGQIWIREDQDAGSPGWAFTVPVEFQANTLPSYRKSDASGSRADVRAAASWESGGWTVEFARALDTRHGDDVAVRERGEGLLAFAVYDRAEQGRHATSGMVRLEVRGR